MSFPLLLAPTTRPVPGVDVGVPAGRSLTPSGPVTLNTGDVLDGYEVSGGINVAAGATDVEIGNVRVVGTTNSAAIYFRPGSSGVVHHTEAVDIDGAAAFIQGDHWRGHHLYCTGLPVDGWKIGSGAMLWSSVLDNMVYADGPDPHPDGMQAQDTVHDLAGAFGNWVDIQYPTDDRANAAAFSNPNFDNYPGDPLGWLLFVGNTLAGGGIALYLANGSLADSATHYVIAAYNRIVRGSYDIAPIALGRGPDHPKQIAFGNTYDDGTLIPTESTRRGTFSRDGDDLIFTYTAGESGAVTLGRLPAEFEPEEGGTPMPMTTAYLDMLAGTAAAQITHAALVDDTDTPVTDRQSATFIRESPGVTRLSVDVAFTVPAGATVAGWRGYSASTGGDDWGGKLLPAEQHVTLSETDTVILRAADTAVDHTAAA